MDLKDARRELALGDPDAERWFRVDADCMSSPAGRFFARPSVSYDFAGTRSHTPGLNPAQCGTEEDSNRHLLAQAMRIASQDRDTRICLLFGNRQGLSYVFDPIATKNQGAAAILDWSEGRPSLWIHPDGPSPVSGQPVWPVDMARQLGHETEHVSQSCADVYNTEENSLVSGIRCVRAREAAARAMGALVAMRFMVNQPGDHPQRWKPKGIEHAFDNDPPSLRKAVAEALPYLAEGHTEKAARRLFMSFYEDDSAMAYYDLRTIDFYKAQLESALKGDDPRRRADFMMRDCFDHRQLTEKLTLGDQLYLKALPVSLDSAPYAGLTRDPRVRDAYLDLTFGLQELRSKGYTPDAQIELRPDAVEPAPARAIRTLLPRRDRPEHAVLAG